MRRLLAIFVINIPVVHIITNPTNKIKRTTTKSRNLTKRLFIKSNALPTIFSPSV